MYCEKCGTQLPEDGGTCSKCGNIKLSVSDINTIVAKRKHKKKTIIIAVLVISVAIGFYVDNNRKMQALREEQEQYMMNQLLAEYHNSLQDTPKTTDSDKYSSLDGKWESKGLYWEFSGNEFTTHMGGGWGTFTISGDNIRLTFPSGKSNTRSFSRISENSITIGTERYTRK